MPKKQPAVRVGKVSAAREKKTPVELDGRLRRKAHMLAERLFVRRKELRELMGASPYRGEELDPTERKRQYQELRGSKANLVNTIADACTLGSGGELRIDKKLLDAFVEFSD